MKPGPWALAAALLAPTLALAQTPAAVPVESPELSGAIAGRVCRDLDGDGECGADEPGLPGARVVLETGQYALTDAKGRYHLAAVGARAPSADAGGRLLPGRHRVALDDRGLTSGSTVSPARATVELPMGGLVLQNFAVRTERRAAAPVVAAYAPKAPAAVVEPGGETLRFPVSGQAEPGDAVTVNGAAAEVDAQGRYWAWATLKIGHNEVAISATSPRGQVRLFVQRVDVVSRPGEGLLVIPRAPEPTAQVALPVGKEEKAATGSTRVRVEGVPGTRIQHPGGEVTVGQEGAAEIPVELRPGVNELPLTVTPPGQPARTDQVEIPAAPRPLVVGLLDLEGTWDRSTGGLRLFGRGGVHGEYRLGGWDLSGELELRDQDVQLFQAAGATALLLPRNPEQLERALDPELYPTEWGDRSTGIVPNSAEGLLRVEARHEQYGRLGLGTYRATMEDAEIGRYQREIFGPYADLSLPLGPAAKVGVSGFYTPGGVDPVRGLATAPAHDELIATGGSLYYLGSDAVAPGTEQVRVVLRDGITQVPIAERHLVRGRDYEIDWAAGRILLARPLSFAEGLPVLRSDALTASPEQVLVVDYERLLLGGDPRQAEGGEAKASVGPVQLSVGAVRERAGEALYRLYRARGSLDLGPLSIHAEAAQSQGTSVDPESFGISDDGGLTFQRPQQVDGTALGQALTVRVRGPGLSPEGHVDAAFRWRSAGFSDQEHAGGALRQLSLRAEQPLGSFVVGVLADDRVAPDPREPFSGSSIAARTLGVSVGYVRPGLEVRLEAKDSQLTAAEDPQSTDEQTGGRTSVGIFARYKLLPWLAVSAGHKQVLAVRGAGPGAIADTFSQVGADVTVREGAEVGARVGYGPVTGPLAWLQGSYQSGSEAWYGTYSVDVDGPDFGEAKAISGVRTRVGDTSSVFVEDVSAHDATSVRLSRAVGFSGELLPGLQLSGRYEHGVRQPLELPSPLARDSAGVTASYLSERLRLFGRAELRLDKGREQLGPPVDVDRQQRVLSAGAELSLLESLHASARFNFSDTYDLGRLEARLLEGTAGLSWRADWGMSVLQYSVQRELPPPSRGGFGERTLQTLSLLPALHLGPRLMLSAGAYAGWSSEAGSSGLVLSASLRPSVRVIGGLEVGAEVARRSSAPDGGELTAVRGEAGYRFDERFLVAVGYTVFGYSGLGLSKGDPASRERVYLRAELAY